MTPRCRVRNAFRHLIREGAEWLTFHQELTAMGVAPCVVAEMANEVKRRAVLAEKAAYIKERRTPITAKKYTAWRRHIFSKPHPRLSGRDWALHATKGWRVVTT